MGAYPVVVTSAKLQIVVIQLFIVSGEKDDQCEVLIFHKLISMNMKHTLHNTDFDET